MMILSHKHKFIFLKTNKTAGTSIEIALSKYCGPDCIITPITPNDEKLRAEFGYPGPQNYREKIRNYSLLDIFETLRYRRAKRKYFNHVSANEIRASVGEDVWRNYYKFCVERNPWDRVVSLYYHVHHQSPRPAVSEFIASGLPTVLKKRGYDLYTIDDQIAVDKVCLFENLAHDLDRVRQKLGITESLALPRAKSGFRKDKLSYREILSKDDRDKITNLFQREIDLFGFQY